MIKALSDTLHQHDFRGVELEFRVGIQTATYGFHASVPKLVWATAKKKFGDSPEVLTVDRYVKTRREESSRHVNAGSSSYWEHKKKVANEVTPTPGRFAIRTSLALETKEDGNAPNSFVLQRNKYRTSFAKGPWRVDFTRVQTIPNKDDVEETFEIEVELVDHGYLFEKELHIVIEEGIAIAKEVVE
jgi:hypothetical protein